IRAMADVKQAACRANVTLGLLPAPIGAAIDQAAGEIAGGALADHFIVDALQGGAGTSTNMNVNEVIANRAVEILGGTKGDYSLVHPLNHVNLSQSTNDVYPTALRVAAIRLLSPLSQAIAELQAAFQQKEAEFAGIVKMGRTELQDAVPVTLGQEFSAFAEAFARDRWRLYKVEERLRQVNLGGTAVGTGLNADRRYAPLVVEQLRAITKLGLARSENLIDGTQNADVFAEVSGLLKASAVNLAKVAADLRLMASGPRTGFGEIRLPALQAGSSIMPGKVNPVMTEMASQVAYQVMAADLAITMAAQAGQLELNALLPLIAHHLLSSLAIMRNAVTLLAQRCVAGIEADADRCRLQLDQSFGMITALVPRLGYEKASELAKEALRAGRTAREVMLDSGLFTAEELDLLLNPKELTHPGVRR
ncbi:MAG: aspartate ammonia-lyase, partial [Mycobacterium leprae]